jgi:hypothetical protein
MIPAYRDMKVVSICAFFIEPFIIVIVEFKLSFLACFQIFSGSISQRILAQARTY